MRTLAQRVPGPWTRAVVVVLAVLAQSACGGGGGGGGATPATAPTISGLTYGPTAVYVGSNGGTDTIFGTFSFSDPDGDVVSARIVTVDGAGKVVSDVTEPIAGLSGDRSGEIEGQIDIGTMVADTFTFRLSVVDSKGLRSNELSGSFRVSEFPWVATSPMPAPRQEFATAVVDGKIYVLGGNDPTYSGWPKPAVSRVDVYDPATDTWAAAPAMPVALVGHAAAAVGGRIYVAGGRPELSPGVKTLYEFNPVTNEWVEKAPMPYELRESAAASAGGRLWVFGGDGLGFDTANALSYDPATDTWASHAPMAEPYREMSAAAVDGRILLIGGYGLPGYLRTVQRYDPVLDTWTARADLPWPPLAQAGAAALDEFVYVAGGHNWDPAGVATLLAYDVVADLWNVKTPMPVALNAPRAETVNGKVYVIEGATTLEYTPENDIL